MPIVQMNLLEGRSDEAKQAAVSAVTDALVRTLQVRPDQVRIMINELPPQNYAIAGRTIQARQEGDAV